MTGRFLVTVRDFVCRPASPLPLSVLRIGLSLVLLIQALAVAGSLHLLYGEYGLVQWPVTNELVTPGVPRIAWLVSALEPLGVSSAACVRWVFLFYLAALGSLLVGWHTRLAAVATWLSHLLLTVSGIPSTYGVDSFANVGLFYCIWMPVGHALSGDHLLGRVKDGPSSAARLGLRVLQIHLCIAYFAAGLSKLLGEQWRSGEAIWQALMQPALATMDFNWLAGFPWLAWLACWATIIVELGYPVLIWPRTTRTIWALAILGMHAGIALTMSLVSFSAVMAVLTLSAFLIPAEPVACFPSRPRMEEQVGLVSAPRAASVRPLCRRMRAAR